MPRRCEDSGSPGKHGRASGVKYNLDNSTTRFAVAAGGYAAGV
jgi:hypothetical protein